MVDLVFNVLPIVCGSSSCFFCVLLCLLYVQFSFAIILKKKRMLVALLLFLTDVLLL